jgi:ribosomal protein S18 acetylase RimI-like enzyme
MKYIERFRNYWHSLIIEEKIARGTVLGSTPVAYYPEIPISTFNHASDVRINEDEIDNLIYKLSKFFKINYVPSLSFRIDPSNRPENLTNILETHGFHKEIYQSVMVFKGNVLEVDPVPGITIEQISENQVSLFNQVLIEIYDMPLEWKKGFDQLTSERLRKGVKCYLAYHNGLPIGTCGLFTSEKTGEIFGVGTMEDYRGRGIATNMVLSAIRDSIQMGNDLHTIRADKGDYPEKLYKKLGFEIDHSTSFYVKSIPKQM